MSVQYYVKEISEKVNNYNEDIMRLCGLISRLRDDIGRIEREVSNLKLDAIEKKQVILHIHKILEGSNAESKTQAL